MAVLNPYNYKKPAVPISVIKKPALSEVKRDKQPKKQGDSYLEQRVMMAKPEELTLMLYEGLIKFIKMSRIYIDQQNNEKGNAMSKRAQAIVAELRATLNTDYEISKEFDALYDFVYSRLIDGNLTKSIKPYDEALEIAIELHDTWKEAMALV